ncbi:MAG: hypothetical protein OXR68_02115 [Alphaproteobacteria bacterium]|nr:hypothetical protein [Alphaproteobacteria bacterium]MDD9919406.1 hypothetical protein [Alphaproteobacteria bacterium]
MTDVNSLARAGSALTQNLHKQGNKIADAAKDLQRSLSVDLQGRGVENQESLTTPEEAPVEFESLNLSSELQTLAASTPEESVVQMLEAKTAYMASLKALDVVNEVESETVDILR